MKISPSSIGYLSILLALAGVFGAPAREGEIARPPNAFLAPERQPAETERHGWTLSSVGQLDPAADAYKYVLLHGSASEAKFAPGSGLFDPETIEFAEHALVEASPSFPLDPDITTRGQNGQTTTGDLRLMKGVGGEISKLKEGMDKLNHLLKRAGESDAMEFMKMVAQRIGDGLRAAARGAAWGLYRGLYKLTSTRGGWVAISTGMVALCITIIFTSGVSAGGIIGLGVFGFFWVALATLLTVGR